jgi:hypothetical protein
VRRTPVDWEPFRDCDNAFALATLRIAMAQDCFPPGAERDVLIEAAMVELRAAVDLMCARVDAAYATLH